MSELTIEQALQAALQHHHAGQLQRAELLYRQVLAQQPNHVDALNLLGVLATQVNRPEIAVDLIRRAIVVQPDFADAHFNLGNALLETSELENAMAAYRRAILLRPDYPEAYNNLGNALKRKGEPDAAIAAYRQAILLNPDFPDALNNLGYALREKKELNHAIAACRQAIALQPNFPEAHNNLGIVLSEKGETDAAVSAFQSAIALRPDFPEAYSNLGNVFRETGRLDAAIDAHRRSILLRPDYAEAWNNLGNALKDTGQLDEAIACYRRAVELNPNWSGAHSNLAYVLHFHPDSDARSIYQEHVRWNDRHAEPLRKLIQPHGNRRDPDRPIRVGYVSPDFRRHPVGRFLLPLLANHDHSQVQVYCYASVHAADELTERLRRHADVWRAVEGLNDAQLAEQVRADQIDILVDLTLHMAGSRLLMFARKPAPIQVSWLGYPGTTGLTAIDYRITDAYMDPPGVNDAYYSEESIRLPDITACYQPSDPTPPVNPLPALTAGYVTFGCLNNFCKVTDATLAAWIQILRAVPGSRLMLYAHAGAHRQRARDRMTAERLDPDRISFVGFGGPKYFEFYHQLDIVLDPFPYGGGTTTCESLWMGVPVITLAGTASVSRLGLATLSCAGVPEFATFSPEAYLRTAIDLAHDLPRLAEVRATLRAKMQSSPLMDAPRFARNMEAAFRMMWRRWCSQ